MKISTALAFVGPMIVFGFLYVLLVQPQRDAAAAARRNLEALRAHVDRQSLFPRPAAVVTQATALRQFEARTADSDPAPEFVESLAALVNSPAVGGVTNLLIETGTAAEVPPDSRTAVFGRRLSYTPVAVAFHGRFEQVGRFFWNLRAMPTTFELRSVELTPAPGGAMRLRAVLFAFHEGAVTPRPPAAVQPQLVDMTTPPQWRRDPFTSTARSRVEARRQTALVTAPRPAVRSILLARGRRVALVDGRIVRVGDRVGPTVVTAIEPEAVVLTGGDNRERRLELERPIIRMARR